MGRPGIVVYFDILGALRVLTKEERGELFVAMLEYGQRGIMPKFSGALALAWEFIQPKLDKDLEEYERTVLKRQYATFCRDRKKNGEPEISFVEWKNTHGGAASGVMITDKAEHHMISHDNQKDHMISHDTTWCPTITTTTTTTTATTTATATATTTTDGSPSCCGEKKSVGLLGKGRVFMSDSEVADLRSKMGDGNFDMYVAKLACYIERNGQQEDHYNTILQWWKDSGL